MFRWTSEYDDFLFETKHLSAREIAEYLGITPHAVYNRRSKLGITFHKVLKPKPLRKGRKNNWPPSMRLIRDFIMSRDNYTCHYCGDPATQVDHKIPTVHGGLNIASNLVAACARCNNLKGTSCYECPKLREKLNV